MKRINALMVATAIFMSSCQDAPNADNVSTTDEQATATVSGNSFVLDSTSTIMWGGTKPDATHTGTFKIAAGTISVDNNQITAGNISIDIASLIDLDLEGEWKTKLEGHLKSPDFFDVEKFPTATFAITKVEDFDSTKVTSILAGATHIISGNLTLKDSTKNISFPAIVSITENGLSAKADFNIDRTLWGMNYKGPNNPADWFIRKEVNLKFDLSAKK